MKSTKSTSKHVYLGTHRNISLYRTEDRIFAHNPDTDGVMDVRLDVALSRLANHASEFHRHHIQKTSEVESDSGYELHSLTLGMMQEAGGVWREVMEAKVWMSRYLAMLVCNPEATAFIWSSFENYALGFEAFRMLEVQNGLTPSPLDKLPSESDLREHYLKWVAQMRRH